MSGRGGCSMRSRSRGCGKCAACVDVSFFPPRLASHADLFLEASSTRARCSTLRRRQSAQESRRSRLTPSCTRSASSATRTPARSTTACSPARCARRSTRSSATVRGDMSTLCSSDARGLTSAHARAGIPDARPLEDGDILNLDVTLYHGGFHGDINGTCTSF